MCLIKNSIIILTLLSLVSCNQSTNSELDYIEISREKYADQLYGFWLGQSIANWTGLITEMDKIGNIGEIKTGGFYTRNDWGKEDQRSIWEDVLVDKAGVKIDFVFKDENQIWGSDDDTDIEYMYQYLLNFYDTSYLSPNQIRDGWLKHIKSDEENYLWVSNQEAFDLMKSGLNPPETGNPINNKSYMMIDAQLTTEIFGLFSPSRPDIGVKMAELPIKTTARNEAQEIAEFYVRMHSLASHPKKFISLKENIFWMAKESRKYLNDNDYPAKMFDFTEKLYNTGIKWEKARDSIYQRYQVDQKDGYNITSKNLYCNGCFAAGINFASSLVSLFYGEGEIKETIKIGTLSGWDSDNPTSTWGGLIGFLLGKEMIEKEFDRKFSSKFNIHRTRQNFPNNGIDSFYNMASEGIRVIDRVIEKEMNGKINLVNNTWLIPIK
ncbi:MAG: ADP-ribosylglycohydrolase family protein [Cryomorphaceae bacterium]|jgi:hypothetical protein|nr:ADP-ribosylglycohydrolase family protein [Cryomorphaceae bacterium]MDG1889266.1 ADP-ribosylglycohydrolase family protein [Flavobacteriaceae bacterium]MBT3688930.1 ADP-ribosylglycohydrolase family protein [Cryomorphaceae bacterium]MBT4222774.1 ADP-ribosylglycohydrolase family protein [Cryomorphaceae bacterium]MBT4518057.1 ADP-ribosylglycohydrolase family protein [Cryomorphaceae bacterium]